MITRVAGVAVLAFLFGVTARAESGKRAVIAVGACSDGKTLEAARQVREALGQTALGYQFLSEEQTAARAGGMPGSVTEARGLLQSARDDVFNPQSRSYARAEEKLRRALAILETTPPSMDRWQTFSEASLVLSYVLFHAGEGKPEIRRIAERQARRSSQSATAECRSARPKNSAVGLPQTFASF